MGEAFHSYMMDREPAVTPLVEAVGMRPSIVGLLQRKGVFAYLDDWKKQAKKAYDKQRKEKGIKDENTPQAAYLDRLAEKRRIKREEAEEAAKLSGAITGEKPPPKLPKAADSYTEMASQLSDEDRAFAEAIRPLVENITKADEYDIDAADELLDEMSEGQIRKLMKVLDIGFVGDDDDWDIDEARDKCVSTMTKMARKHRQEKTDQMNRRDKQEMALKKKYTHQQIKDMLDDVGIPYNDKFDKVDLRNFALEVDLLDKYDALPADYKLERNRERSMAGIQAFEARKAYEKEKAKIEKEKREKMLEDKLGPMHDNEMYKSYQPWEVEWDNEMELEAIERLRQLPMWHTLSPDMVDGMMAKIKRNPRMLDYIESETRSLGQIRDQMGPNGEMPDMDVLRAAGLSLKNVGGKKDEEAAPEVDGLDASVAAADASMGAASVA
jgi:hypothetical protein